MAWLAEMMLSSCGSDSLDTCSCPVRRTLHLVVQAGVVLHPVPAVLVRRRLHDSSTGGWQLVVPSTRDVTRRQRIVD